MRQDESEDLARSVERFHAGQRVRLDCSGTGNDRLHGAEAMILVLEEWGAHVATPASAVGQYRAAWEEMVPLEEVGKVEIQQAVSEVESEALARSVKTVVSSALVVNQATVYTRRAGDGYSGDCCSNCGGVRLRRDGKCLVCDDCGSTAGGCS